MVQAVSHWPFTTKAQVHAQVTLSGICGGQSGNGKGFSVSSSVPLSVPFHHGSPYSYIIWGINNSPFGGRSSEIQSHPIDRNNKYYNSNVTKLSLRLLKIKA
jgi:hypothetical protein